MKHRKHILLIGILSALGTNAQAALTNNTLLTMDPAVLGCLGDAGVYPVCDYGPKVISGTYFSMGGSKVGVSPGPDGGIFMGLVQPASGAHGGFPDGVSESPSIDMPWGYFCNTGMHYLSAPVSVINEDVNSDGGFTKSIDLSGWTVGWSGIPSIPIGGNATIVCAVANCPVGTTYVLDFATPIPSSPLHSFGGVAYAFHMEGTVTQVAPFDVSADAITPVFDGSPVILDVLSNDTRVTNYSFAPTLDAATVMIVTAPSFGTAQENLDGTITYNRSALDYASADTLTYTVTDTAGFVSSPTTVTIIGTNPYVANASGVTESDTAIVFDVATTATDNTAIVAASTLVSAAALHGSVDNPADGTLTYTPNAGFTGIDTFSVTMEDDELNLSSPGIITVTVNANKPGSDAGDFVPGATADSLGNLTGGGLTTDEVGADAAMEQQCVGGCVDFAINGLSNGAAVNVVVPLSAAIPADAVYRKLMNGVWADFVSDADNTLASAPALTSAPLVCPAAGDAAYVSGLNAGDVCLQLTMNEGGANDADGVADGSLLDPGGIGVVMPAAIPAEPAATPAAPAAKSSSGCSIATSATGIDQHADWWLVAGFLALLGMFRRKSV